MPRFHNILVQLLFLLVFAGVYPVMDAKAAGGNIEYVTIDGRAVEEVVAEWMAANEATWKPVVDAALN